MNKNRIGRVMKNMESLGLKQLLVSSLESIYYLSGLWVPQGERMLVLKLDLDGSLTLFVNRMFALKGLEGDAKLVEFDDIDDSVKILADTLKSGALGIEKTWPSHFLIRLMALRPDVIPTLGSRCVDEARMFKDEQEVAAMRLASRLNDQSVGQVLRSLTPNDTEMAVGRRFTDTAIALGADGTSFTPLVCFGANAAEPHHSTDHTELKKGDAVILDLGCAKDHYMADMTRTVFFGSATDEQKKVYDIVLAANMAAEAAIRPGVKLSDIDRAARSLIEDNGFGPNFLHRTGHGIGIEVHEPPDVSLTSEAVCTPGMCFSIEPGIYLPGKFGVRIEDLVLVTEDGCEVLNQLDRDFLLV